MTKAPERIYLQAGMDYTDAIVNGEVTWCADRQEDDDTEYLRADLSPSHEAFQQMREALEICVKHGSVYGHKAAVAALKAAEESK